MTSCHFTDEMHKAQGIGVFYQSYSQQWGLGIEPDSLISQSLPLTVMLCLLLITCVFSLKNELKNNMPVIQHKHHLKQLRGMWTFMRTSIILEMYGQTLSPMCPQPPEFYCSKALPYSLGHWWILFCVPGAFIMIIHVFIISCTW